MRQPEFYLLDQTAVEIVRNPRRQRLSIEVSSQGVKARAPMRLSQSSIEEFIESKRAWINKHLNNLPPPLPDFALTTGEQLELFGEPYTLEVIPQSTRKAQLINTQERQVIVLTVKTNNHEAVKRKLIAWFKQQAQLALAHSIEYFARHMAIPGDKRLSVKVRDYKRRWGSCDQDGNLAFNWRIIQAPREVLDYVVVHELAHCHEFNHSKRFWAIVATQMPDWQRHQQWLADHGARLYRL